MSVYIGPASRGGIHFAGCEEDSKYFCEKTGGEWGTFYSIYGQYHCKCPEGKVFFKWTDENKIGCRTCKEGDDYCFKSLAVKEKNPEICMKIKELDIWPCIIGVAKSSENSYICNQFSDYLIYGVEECYSRSNFYFKSYKECLEFEENYKKNLCLGVWGRRLSNSEICNMIDIIDKQNAKEIRDVCFKYVAQNTKNPALCNFINDSYRRDRCINSLYSNLIKVSKVLGFDSNSKKETIEVIVHNPTDKVWESVFPYISCNNLAIKNQSTEPWTIEPEESATFDIEIKFLKLNKSDICELIVKNSDGPVNDYKLSLPIAVI
ncbi:MAG: hypothetical protein KAK00_11045 [Nanoarchaeota archaeon]|nr:hypothetical protein [Nanoarchaeota archaeon]